MLPINHTLLSFSLTGQGDDSDVRSVKMELSTESDLFFFYTHTCDLESFHAMQEQQKLMVDFADYANVLIRMLNNCIREPHNHLAVYLLQADGRARLDFIKNMEYKFVVLLSVDFMRSTDDAIRQHITFRYNAMKARLQVLQTRLHVRGWFVNAIENSSRKLIVLTGSQQHRQDQEPVAAASGICERRQT